MTLSEKNRFSISPFFVFFLIHANQVGVGILNFQRKITVHAGYDAWISVLIAGFVTSVFVWMMYRILKLANHDMIYINQICFGKWAGNLLNCFVIFYFLTGAIVVLSSYIEVVHTWMFPLMKTWHLTIILLLLIYYIVSGGLRIVAGVCFYGVILPLMLTVILVFLPLKFLKWDHFFPVFSHSFTDILISSDAMSLEYLGFEALLMFYPFIKKPEKSEKWAQWGIGFTMVLYLFVSLLTFSYYSEGQLKHIIWPTLTIVKIIEMPFIERVEYIVISCWLMIIVPNICLNIWAACRGAKRLFRFKFKQRVLLIFFLALLFLASETLNNRMMIIDVNKLFAGAGSYFIYGYIPLIFIIMHIRKFLKKS